MLRALLALPVFALLLFGQPASAQVTPAVGLDDWSDCFWYSASEYWDSPNLGGNGDDWL
jgi:hypothetical protein